MKKAFEILALTLSSAAIAACALAFSACGSDDGYDEENDYMVTVTYSDGTPVKGSDNYYYVSEGEEAGLGAVTAQWCEYDTATNTLGTCYTAVALDDNGKAKYENKSDLEGKTIHIQINIYVQISDGSWLSTDYHYDHDELITSAGNVNITLPFSLYSGE